MKIMVQKEEERDIEITAHSFLQLSSHHFVSLVKAGYWREERK